MRPQNMWHGTSGHASTHHLAPNVRTCVHTSNTIELQLQLLEIILKILVVVNFRDVVSCDVTPWGLVDVSNRLEADFASIFGLEKNANYFIYGFKKEIWIRGESFLLPLFKLHMTYLQFFGMKSSELGQCYTNFPLPISLLYCNI